MKRICVTKWLEPPSLEVAVDVSSWGEMSRVQILLTHWCWILRLRLVSALYFRVAIRMYNHSEHLLRVREIRPGGTKRLMIK